MKPPAEWITVSRQEAVEQGQLGPQGEAELVALDDGRVIGGAGEPIPGLRAQQVRGEEREAG